ncbi:hypothetical protein AXXA_15552 [Achromobacter insuavis AXX-A]|uniref:Uncharacterized protein n=1 Tax=Achromobacter insuavis AXX-A TaxID=1003200 RepID=F7T2E8_9BURK|nr:hypothetical protein AXXA_15552 [Achromobacter insuavis AXX-A]
MVSPARQATMLASPACTARAARRRAPTPLAPPMGIWSSQRGLMPRCWVRPTALSGASVKLDTHRPSTSVLAMPAWRISAPSARPSHQWAAWVE